MDGWWGASGNPSWIARLHVRACLLPPPSCSPPVCTHHAGWQVDLVELFTNQRTVFRRGGAGRRRRQGGSWRGCRGQRLVSRRGEPLTPSSHHPVTIQSHTSLSPAAWVLPPPTQTSTPTAAGRPVGAAPCVCCCGRHGRRWRGARPASTRPHAWASDRGLLCHNPAHRIPLHVWGLGFWPEAAGRSEEQRDGSPVAV